MTPAVQGCANAASAGAAFVEIMREDKSAGQPIWARTARSKGDGTGMCRRQFGKGNDFAQKITYRTTGAKPKDLINEFRTSPMPRIAVTVDMIATGTDIKAVEVVMFMRAVKSHAFFEQMKGCGVRIMRADDLQSVIPDARAKDHFVIVDAVGVCEQDKNDSRPMEQKFTISFERLMQAVALGNIEEDVLSSLAGRLARMEHRLTPEDDKKIRALSCGQRVKEPNPHIAAALERGRYVEQAQVNLGIAPREVRQICIENHQFDKGVNSGNGLA